MTIKKLFHVVGLNILRIVIKIIIMMLNSIIVIYLIKICTIVVMVSALQNWKKLLGMLMQMLTAWKLNWMKTQHKKRKGGLLNEKSFVFVCISFFVWNVCTCRGTR